MCSSRLFPWSSVIEAEHPIRNIASLLNFEQQTASANRMYLASRKEENITLVMVCGRRGTPSPRQF